MVELSAKGDADQVETRLREALDAHGLQLFARIDHAAGARKADVDLEANVLLIFGKTSVGTPLMQADPEVGIELPLRMLIWEDPDGTHVGYLDPRELADRYALNGHQQTLERQSAVLAKLAAAAAGSDSATVDMGLEVVTLPVSDTDRAKQFYESLGWRVDADIVVGDAFRVVQVTPTRSACSIAFGKGVTTAEPGSAQRLILAVSDIEAARHDLVARGVDVSGVFHLAGGQVPGPDPERRSYQTYASFSDPDGNAWLLQEITTRLPGREWK